MLQTKLPSWLGSKWWLTVLPEAGVGGMKVPGFGGLARLGSLARRTGLAQRMARRLMKVGGAAARVPAVGQLGKIAAGGAAFGLGSAGIESLLSGGALPAGALGVRRRRAKGLSGRDLQGFKRTLRLINSIPCRCKMRRAPKRRKC